MERVDQRRLERPEAGMRVAGADRRARVDHLRDARAAEQHAPGDRWCRCSKLLDEDRLERAGDELDALGRAVAREPADRGAGAGALELDVHADTAARQREDLHEPRDRLPRAEIHTRELGRGEVGDPLRPACERAQVFVVNDHDLAVAREVHVDLDEVESVVDRELDRAQRVLRGERARPAVTDRPRPRGLGGVHGVLTVRPQGRYTAGVDSRRIVGGRLTHEQTDRARAHGGGVPPLATAVPRDERRPRRRGGVHHDTGSRAVRRCDRGHREAERVDDRS